MAELLRHTPHHIPFVGQVPVPHGPETGDEHDDYPEGGYTADEEHRIFRYLTRPDDSYTQDGTYWADLKWRERVAFVTRVDRQESRKELSATWAMMKRDPLAPLGWYARNAILPGAGLGLEGYVLFSIGTLTPLFDLAWPDCWGSSPTACSLNWIAAVTYLEVIGIMAGQMAVGVRVFPPLTRAAPGVRPPAPGNVVADGLFDLRSLATGWDGGGV